MCTLASTVDVPIPSLPSLSKRANSESSLELTSWTNVSTRRSLLSLRLLILFTESPELGSVVTNAKPVNVNEPPPENSISPFTTSFVFEPRPTASERLPPITTIPDTLVIHIGTSPVAASSTRSSKDSFWDV